MDKPRLLKLRAFCTLTTLVLAASSWAQNLPMRNLQLEVRQVQSRAVEGSAVQGTLRLEGNANGALDASGAVRWGQGQTRQSGSTLQTSLVLNGRSTWIGLGQVQPVRLWQTIYRNGMPYAVAGAVLLQSTTGFAATPRWASSDTVELELSAQQRLANNPSTGLPGQGAFSSVLLVPLDTWTTVAQVEEQGRSEASGSLGQRTGSESVRTEVQVRVGLR